MKALDRLEPIDDAWTANLQPSDPATALLSGPTCANERDAIVEVFELATPLVGLHRVLDRLIDLRFFQFAANVGFKYLIPEIFIGLDKIISFRK